LRGKLPRRINYFPATGKVTMRKLSQQDDVAQVDRSEQALAQALSGRQGRSKVELFDRDVARDAANKNAWAL
jgi:chemotaxis protein CheD